MEEQKKQTEAEMLKKQIEDYKAIVSNVTSGVALIDNAGRFLLYNLEFLRLFGLSESSTIINVNDQRWGDWQVFDENLELLHVDEHPVRKTAITRKPVKNQLVAVRLPSGGDLIWMLVSAEPLLNESGNIEKIICTYQNVTQRKLSEERLSALNATKDKFFSIIAHDLRSPFSSIIGFSDLLIETIHGKKYDKIEEYAQMIQKSAWQAIDLQKNLFEWARLNTGSIVFKPDEFELVSAIEEIIGHSADSAWQKSITIDADLPPGLIVKADRYMLSSVFRNLISNAIKFTKPGGKVSISVLKRKSDVFISVRDTGVGISENELKKLFRLDLSYSLRGTNGEEGTGLGLLLSKDFISKHGGKIWVESEPGKGSSFMISIPA